MMVLLTAMVVVASEIKMNQKIEKVTMEDRKKKIGGKNRSITLICNLNVRIYYLMYVHTNITSFKKY